MIRVFVVDDSPFIRKALTRALGAAGDIRVCGEARSAEEALRLVPDANPDVVTLDVAMEGMDGLAALRGLLAWRAQHAGHHALGAHGEGRGRDPRGAVTRCGRRDRQG